MKIPEFYSHFLTTYDKSKKIHTILALGYFLSCFVLCILSALHWKYASAFSEICLMWVLPKCIRNRLFRMKYILRWVCNVTLNLQQVDMFGKWQVSCVKEQRWLALWQFFLCCCCIGFSFNLLCCSSEKSSSVPFLFL